ncbi:hypothetical protein TNCV_3077571 [Trichonephila clavipes]|nr:hypothetical protein TNCV_3077571 [Trichonephila clavipes]
MHRVESTILKATLQFWKYSEVTEGEIRGGRRTWRNKCFRPPLLFGACSYEPLQKPFHCFQRCGKSVDVQNIRRLRHFPCFPRSVDATQKFRCIAWCVSSLSTSSTCPAEEEQDRHQTVR